MICSYQSFILAHDVKRRAHAANTVANSTRGFDVIGPNPTFVLFEACGRFEATAGGHSRPKFSFSQSLAASKHSFSQFEYSEKEDNMRDRSIPIQAAAIV